MAFPCAFYNAEPSFNSLFRLLEDIDKCSRRPAPQVAIPQWQPKFDIRETTRGFELHGEFPGVDKENVHVKFVDPQTMVVYGKTVRAHSSNSTAAPEEKAAEEKATVNNAKAEEATKEQTPASDAASDTSSKRSSYQATVEDDDEDKFETISYNGDSTPQEVEKTEPKKTEVAQQKPAEVQKTTPTKEKPAANTRHWLSERTVGQFSRSFHFPTRVNHEAVTAKFKDGVLSINVPKARKPQMRFISIF